MRSYFGNILPIIFLLISTAAFANDSSYIKFNFSDALPAGKFRITISDGIQDHQINPQNTRDWHGELFAPFGQILIAYSDTDTSVSVRKAFFEKGRSEVVVTTSSIAGQYYSIDESSSINIIPYSKMGGDAYDAFIKEKADSQMAFYHRNKHDFGRDRALVDKALALSDSVILKKIEFIRRFPDLEISSWVFINERIAQTNCLGPEKLMELYKTVFSDASKRSKATNHLVEIIRNKLAVTYKDNFPDFSTVDINNNKVELSKLRGSYVLIQFWASWCIPCIAEMPDLKSIYNKYGGPEFRLISFSIDKNPEAGRKAIEKHSMNWTQVVGDLHLYNSLGYVPIPQLYLIDKTGRTIYNDTITKDSDLVLLKKILSEHLTAH